MEKMFIKKRKKFKNIKIDEKNKSRLKIRKKTCILEIVNQD